MAGPEFFQTRMGQVFYEGTMPALVSALKKLNENLEKVADGSLLPKLATAIMHAPLLVEKPLSTEGHTPEFYYDLLKKLSREAQQSGEAAGHMIGDHLIDMEWSDQSHPDGKVDLDDINLVVAELKNIEEWAASIRKKLEQEL